MFKVNDNWNSSSKNAFAFHTSKKQKQGKQSKSKHKTKPSLKSLNNEDETEYSMTKNSPSSELGVISKSKKIKHKKKEFNSINKSNKEIVKQQCKNECEPSSNSSLADRLRVNLKGGHFRFLNEKLYTSDGITARKMFKESPEDFIAYHEGYRHQVEQWPLNPLDRVIKYVKKMPNHIIVADFGCGEGRLAKSVPHKVYSMDLMSNSPDIISCDMANTHLENKCIDLGIYCLSLMGINIKDFVLEANRVIKLGGTLYIAEIASRFENVHIFIKKMSTWGFDLTKKDLSHKLFYFFIFKKVKNVEKNEYMDNFSLKPCLYKRR